jgi:UDP-N-acetylglucosamine 2-epimerase (non-hydrolysing)
MSKVFFDELNLPRPDIYLGVGSGTHAVQTAEIMKRFEAELEIHKPAIVVVVGDVNSTIACGLTTVKSQVRTGETARLRAAYVRFLEQRQVDQPLRPAHQKWTQPSHAPLLVHVESGERSFDFNMPEEINRITTDVLSDLLFTTTEQSSMNLYEEGIDPRKVFLAGNIMLDAVDQNLKRAKDSSILETLNAAGKSANIDIHGDAGYAVATLHRAGNVDESSVLRSLLSALMQVGVHLPIVFPVHPRTRKLIDGLDREFRAGLDQSHILVTEPLGYLDFLHLISRSRLVLTDSGGIQVETTYLGIPCLTLRPNTEWEITIQEGTNQLVKVADIPDKVVGILIKEGRTPANIPYWDGKTAQRIVKTLLQLIRISE